MSTPLANINWDRVREIEERIRIVNQAVVGLENPKNNAALIDVSPSGAYNDRAFILQAVMVLSERGFDVELQSELIIGKVDPTYGHIESCGLRIMLKVTRSTRTPRIKPIYINIPKIEDDLAAWEAACQPFFTTVEVVPAEEVKQDG